MRDKQILHTVHVLDPMKNMDASYCGMPKRGKLFIDEKSLITIRAKLCKNCVRLMNRRRDRRKL